ncbi:hypothetical protein ACTIVE_1763 [Actinomadura verrucosospora]|uniref:Uncharacterized protein n=1 Tax=Actinomadura verrucosospora TaxID=46165 RepID=A0A7D4A486_ACTVE|nr:hypothetical protein ACTIVE_1763 [Actinomadura verrucosospora]
MQLAGEEFGALIRVGFVIDHVLESSDSLAMRT